MSRALVYHQANQSSADWCAGEMRLQAEWWQKWRKYFTDQRCAGIAQEIHSLTLSRRALMARVQLTKDAAPNAYAAALYALREQLLDTRKLMSKLEMALEGLTPAMVDQLVSLR